MSTQYLGLRPSDWLWIALFLVPLGIFLRTILGGPNAKLSVFADELFGKGNWKYDFFDLTIKVFFPQVCGGIDGSSVCVVVQDAGVIKKDFYVYTYLQAQAKHPGLILDLGANLESFGGDLAEAIGQLFDSPGFGRLATQPDRPTAQWRLPKGDAYSRDGMIFIRRHMGGALIAETVRLDVKSLTRLVNLGF